MHFNIFRGDLIDISARTEALLTIPFVCFQSNLSAEERDRLEDGFAMLIAGVEHHPQGMGQTFKVVTITPSEAPVRFPFSELLPKQD